MDGERREAGADAAVLRVGYLGPEGTFSHEAALVGTATAGPVDLIALPTIYEVVMALATGAVQRAVVPMENSIEGSVSVTLDTLAIDAPDVHIVAEQVHRIEQCLIAAAPIALEAIDTVLSHPQAAAQCARFLHEQLPQARVQTTSSTADAVRLVAEQGGAMAALGPRLAADRYGCVRLADGVEDRAANATRFIWLSRDADGWAPAGPGDVSAGVGGWKTSLVFWGDGSGQPGWLLGCLSELSQRGVNLTRIESRPSKQGLGSYIFFVDCEGRSEDPPVAAALHALAGQLQVLRVLGSYPAAPDPV